MAKIKIWFVLGLALAVSSCGFLDRVDDSKSSSSNRSNNNSTNQNTQAKPATGSQKCLQTFGSVPFACTELSGNYPAACLGYGKEVVECPIGFNTSCSWDFKTYVATAYYYYDNSVDWIKNYYKQNGVNPDEMPINWEEEVKKSETSFNDSMKEQCENTGGKYAEQPQP